MTIESLNYYGYNKETYKKCQELIWETNLKHAQILTIWFTALCAIIWFLCWKNMFGIIAGNPVVYISYFLLGFLWIIRIFLSKKLSKTQIRISIFINIVYMVSFSIYSSVVQPYMAASMFLVFIVVLSISYIDTFFVATVIQLLSCILFGWTSHIFKPLSITYVDTYNVIVFFILALVLHYSFQHTRISHFVTYYENVEIQHDLQVRSSFDALTSLLNRGRFFTMANEIIRAPHDDYIAVCLFDLDGFKQINDQLGHQMGDKAIQLAGENLMKGFGIDFGERWTFQERAIHEQLSFAGRLGGDEFIVLLRGRTGKAAVKEEALKVLEALSQVQAGELKGIYSSVGIAELSPADRDLDVAYSKADEALYRSKAAGKHQITFSE